jgi:hypothetical protein
METELDASNRGHVIEFPRDLALATGNAYTACRRPGRGSGKAKKEEVF